MPMKLKYPELLTPTSRAPAALARASRREAATHTPILAVKDAREQREREAAPRTNARTPAFVPVHLRKPTLGEKE